MKTNQEGRAAYLNASERNLRIEKLPIEKAIGPISFALLCHRDRYKSFEVEPYDARNVLCFGAGQLAGSKLYGFHRLLFAASKPHALREKLKRQNLFIVTTLNLLQR